MVDDISFCEYTDSAAIDAIILGNSCLRETTARVAYCARISRYHVWCLAKYAEETTVSIRKEL
jgi:hypothetical protein